MDHAQKVTLVTFRPRSTILWYLIIASVLLSIAIGAAGYLLISKVDVEQMDAPIRQRARPTGIFIGALILLEGFGIGLLVCQEHWRLRKDHETMIKQMTRARHLDSLTRYANDSVLLLDQDLKVVDPKESRGKPEGFSRDKSLSLEGEIGEAEGQEMRGDETEAERNSRLIEAEGGRFYQSILEDIDLTERRLTENALSKIRGRYRIVSEFTSDWIYWRGLNREVFYVSPACEEISGYPPQEFYKSPDLLDTMVHPDEGAVWTHHSHQELVHEPCVPLEFRIITRKGEIHWISHFCKPVHDRNGKFLGVCGSNCDITVQKRAEEALRVKTDELVRSNAELEQFAYAASHDLQTPLRAISGYLNLLSKRYGGELNAEATRFIERTIQSAHRMQRLINDLLTYSRVSTRGNPFQPTDCNTVLREVLDTLQPSIEETGAVITCHSLPTVFGDSGQLAQLFQNLIDNAIKFRDEESPQIHIDAQRLDGNWLFSVRDNGIGIDLQYTERIFLIFQRLHTLDKYPGTGIGLSICKKIVERHGGRIWVNSREGEGSTFHFIIPDQGGHPA